MKKFIVILFATVMVIGVNGHSSEGMTNELPSSNECKELKILINNLAGEIILMSDDFKYHFLKNPAMIKNFQKAMFYFNNKMKDEENALISLDKYLNIASQKKYDSYKDDKFQGKGELIRANMIKYFKFECYK